MCGIQALVDGVCGEVLGSEVRGLGLCMMGKYGDMTVGFVLFEDVRVAMLSI